VRAHIRFWPAGWRVSFLFVRRHWLGWLSLCLSLVLVACGGSKSSPSSATTTVTPTGTISLFAGSIGLSGTEDGNAQAASRLNEPAAIASDGSYLYVADTANSTIRLIDISTGAVTTLAGVAGATGNVDGQGGSARFNQPEGIAIDSSNSTASLVQLYVADTGNDTVRKLSVTLGSSGASAQVTTVAGGAGVAGASDGKGTSARFNGPYGIAVDGSGVVYVSDTGNSIIRKIDTAGNVTTFAGAMLQTSVATTAGSSSSTTVQTASDSITPGATTTGSPAVTTTLSYAPSPGFQDGLLPVGGVNLSSSQVYPQLNRPEGLAFGSGTLYVADTGNNAIRTVSSTGNLQTLVGGGNPKDGLSGSSDSDPGNGVLPRFNGPSGLTLDTSGNLYVADAGNALVRAVFASTCSSVASCTSTASGCTSTASCTVATYAGTLSAAVTEYLTTESATPETENLSNNSVTAGSTLTASLTSLTAPSLGPVSDTGTTTGSVTTYNATTVTGGVVAASANTFSLQNIQYYLTTTVQAESLDLTTRTVSPLPTPCATTPATSSPYVQEVSITATSNACASTVYSTTPPTLGPLQTQPQVSGNSETYNIESIVINSVDITPPAPLPGSADGLALPSTTSSVAVAQFQAPSGLVMAGGALYVADAGNSTIRKVSSALVDTIAGSAGQPGAADGLGAQARLYNPTGVVVYHDPDVAGKTYVFEADSANDTIRMITQTVANGTTTSLVSTIAGTVGVAGWLDGTGAGNTRFNTPLGLAMDNSNPLNPIIYVADGNNDIIRTLSTSRSASVSLDQPSVAWTVATLAGDTSTLANTIPAASPGLVDSKDGAGTAKFDFPYGLAVYQHNIYVADSLNDAIRMITPAGVVTTIAGSYDGTFLPTAGAVVGGNALSARFRYPEGIAVDNSGVIFFTEAGNDTVRMLSSVTTHGQSVLFAYPVAGTAGSAGSGDGVGIAASFDAPNGIVVQTTSSGEYLYVADTNNDTIRKIDVTTGASTIDTVSTVVGVAGTLGFLPGATPGYINAPVCLFLDPASSTPADLYVTMGDAVVKVQNVP